MHTDVRHKNMALAAPLREVVRRRLARRFGRLAEEVTSTLVHLEDTNGPRGGVDKRCLVTVSGRRVGTIVARAEAASAGAAVHEALERARHALLRALGRKRRG